MDEGSPISDDPFISQRGTFEGTMPAYPTAIVVGRNFRIQFIVKNAEIYKNLLDRNALLQFGPVLLRMNEMTNNTVKTYSLNTSIQTKAFINNTLRETHTKAQLNTPVQPITTTTVPTTVKPIASTVLTNPTVASNLGMEPAVVTINPAILNAARLNVIRNRSLDPPTKLRKNDWNTDKFYIANNKVQYLNFSKLQYLATLYSIKIQGIAAENGSKKRLSDADVSWVCTDGKELPQQIKTDGNGVYSLSLSKNKTYWVQISKKGYKPLQQQISTGNLNELKIEHLLSTDAVPAHQQVQDTDIRIIGVVYKKLGNVPNPDQAIAQGDWI